MPIPAYQTDGINIEQQRSPTIEARTLQAMIQYSREIAFGAEVAAESLHATVLDPIGFAARLGEHLRVLESELKEAVETES